MLPFQNRNFLHEKKETSLCAFTMQNLISVSIREGTIISPSFSASCHYVVFLKYFHRGPDIHLQSLCIYFLLRTHIIKLKVNSMKIISTITVVANLRIARAKVARQSEAIISSIISSTQEGLMASGLRASRSLRTELHFNREILIDYNSLH